jgi:hypothetical protein
MDRWLRSQSGYFAARSWQGGRGEPAQDANTHASGAGVLTKKGGAIHPTGATMAATLRCQAYVTHNSFMMYSALEEFSAEDNRTKQPDRDGQ